MKTLKDRFWDKVEILSKNECWLWKASRSNKRYGNIKVNGKMIKSHRLSYEFCHGNIPDGLCVLHKCDNGLCVNPDHLFLGTQHDNVNDCIKKGRVANHKGINNGKSKLIPNDIKDIRLNCIKGHRSFGMSSFARKYNVTPQAVWGIVNNKNWTHL